MNLLKYLENQGAGTASPTVILATGTAGFVGSVILTGVIVWAAVVKFRSMMPGIKRSGFQSHMVGEFFYGFLEILVSLGEIALKIAGIFFLGWVFNRFAREITGQVWFGWLVGCIFTGGFLLGWIFYKKPHIVRTLYERGRKFIERRDE